MKAYYSALIDKSTFSENAKLYKNLSVTLREILRHANLKYNAKKSTHSYFYQRKNNSKKQLIQRPLSKRKKNCKNNFKNTTPRTDQCLKKNSITAES